MRTSHADLARAARRAGPSATVGRAWPPSTSWRPRPRRDARASPRRSPASGSSSEPSARRSPPWWSRSCSASASGRSSASHVATTSVPIPRAQASRASSLADVSIGVIGVLIITSEYTSGMIRATLAATPRRGMVLLAKTIVLFAATLVAGEVCAFVSFLVGQVILHGYAPTASLASHATLLAVLLAGLSLTLLALMAMGIATMLRHTAGGDRRLRHAPARGVLHRGGAPELVERPRLPASFPRSSPSRCVRP